MRISFDIGGVISKYPDAFRKLIEHLILGGAVVFIITDMPDHDKASRMVWDNGFPIDADYVLCADYEEHSERCKQVLIEKHGIDMHFDDFAAYCSHQSCVSLFVWPNPDLPYYADDFRTPDAFRFSRARPKALK